MENNHIYWLTSGPMDYWTAWELFQHCSEETVAAATELFIRGVADFSSCVDWDLREYTLHISLSPLAVAFKSDSDGTVNAFTYAPPPLHQNIVHDFGMDWEVRGTASTQHSSKRNVVIH